MYQNAEPRKVNNLTLIDGKTFLSTTIAGDIMPPGSPDVGFFHDDTRFLSRMELRVDGYRTVVLSSSTEQTFASQIELTTGKSTMRDTYEIPENTVHIRREQLLSSETLFDNFSFENFNFHELELNIELAYEADFMDVFQVRGVAREKLGHYFLPIVRRRLHYVSLLRPGWHCPRNRDSSFSGAGHGGRHHGAVEAAACRHLSASSSRPR